MSLLTLSFIFHYFAIIFPWKRERTFIWTNQNLLHPRMLCARVGWNWPSGSGEKDFLILSMYFRSFIIICPWNRTGPFVWIHFNPLYSRMLCAKFGLKLAQWFWRRSWKCVNDRQEVIRKAHLSFQLRWAKKEEALSKGGLLT